MEFAHDLFIQRKHSVYTFRKVEGLHNLKAPEPKHVLHLPYDEIKQLCVDSDIIHVEPKEFFEDKFSESKMSINE